MKFSMKKTVSTVLLLALAAQSMTAIASANEVMLISELPAAEETAVTGTFENVSDNGEDMISLSEARTYKAMIPVSADVDPAAVTWTMTRNAD